MSNLINFALKEEFSKMGGLSKGSKLEEVKIPTAASGGASAQQTNEKVD